MATQYAPKISTDGLVLCLDAANPESYPGSGTTWYDLSGNGNHGTLVNGPTFNTDKGGNIIFDGVNDYCSLPNIDTYSSNAKFTISFFVKPISGNLGRIFSNHSDPDTGDINDTQENIDVFIYTQSNIPYLRLHVGLAIIISGYKISNTIWGNTNFIMFGALSVDKENNNGYYMFNFIDQGNSQLINNTISSTFTPGGATYFVENRIGAETDNEAYSRMDMYNFSMYNRALTPTEITQNYNSLKSRFNI